jgi:exopolysaccharide production protein ExoY
MTSLELTQAAHNRVSRTAVVESSRWYGVAKRSIDLIVASALLIIASPLLLFVSMAVCVSSPGPILFRQARLGRQGRRFTMYKFRTMKCDSVAVGRDLCHRNAVCIVESGQRKPRHNPDVTALGAWLRRSSLDELPNLFNVLLGDMSLVGPRPGSWAPSSYGAARQEILSVKPGVTGLWQVMGRGNLTFAERVLLELEYVRRRSLALDLWILIRTVPVVLSQRGAY